MGQSVTAPTMYGMLSLLLAGALLTQPSTLPGPPRLKVGSFVLLTDGVSPAHGVPRPMPTLTDAQGHPVSRAHWLNRPLKVLKETPTVYVLAQGSAQVWLPKVKLATTSVFPLSQNLKTMALAQGLSQKPVYVNGQPLFPCEVVPGYHALVTFKTARVNSVWGVEGDQRPNKHSSGPALLVMLTPTSEVKFIAAEMEPGLQDQSVRLMAQVSQRCTSLAGMYANTNELHRTLTPVAPPRLPPLPNDPDAQQHALIGWTRAQVLAKYGSPNEIGSLSAILNLKQWTYGGDAYSRVQFSFGPDHRVERAVVGRSP